MKIYMNRVLSSVAMVALIVSTFVPAVAVAQQGGPVREFTASILPTTVSSGEVEFEVTFENSSLSTEDIKAGRVTLPDGFVVKNPPTPTLSGVSGWAVCATEVGATEIQFGTVANADGLAPGDSLTLQFTANVTATAGSHVFDTRAFKNSSCNPGDGAEFGSDDVTVVVEPPVTTGALVVTKTTTGGDGTFNFTGNAGAFSITTVGGTGSRALSGLAAGEYSISETAQAGWTVTSNTCSNVVVSAGATSTCALVNAFDETPTTGTLTVKKDVVDSDGVTDVTDDQTFTVTLDGTNSASFSEESDAVYADLAPGPYTLAELADPNYTYVSGAGSVTVKAGENTVVTIVNKKNEVAVPTGSITVCKIVLDAEGNVIDGAEGTTFTISGLTPDPETAQGAPHGILPNSIFNTPLVLNQKILAASEGNDAECKIYDGLTLDTVGNTGGYYYGQEQIESALEWLTPKYTDQYNESVLDLSDFFAYDSALFDENPENDAGRNQNADGHVTLSTQRPDRTLVVLNQLKSAPVCDAEASQTIVSDTLTLENGDASVPVSPINAAWTAAISGATWIWGENPVADSVATTSQTFTRTFSIVGTPTGATLEIAADNTYSVSINGTVIGSDLSETNYKLSGQDSYVIPAELLVSGENTITITVTNIGLPGSTPLTNPAGLLYKLVVTNNECEVPPPPACSDDLDNDKDGLIDEADPACHTDGNVNNPESYDEDIDSEVNESAACSDGLDNDNDGLIDSLDPNCHTDGNANNPESWDPEDDDESSPVTPPTDVCSNIEGVQETVPSGYVANDGVCEERRSSGGGGSRRSSGSVLGASTGEVLGASCGLYMDRYLKLGAPTNDEVQVIKLQAFLNTQGLFNRIPTGVFDMRTHNAVKDFQEKYFADILTPWGLTGPTGLVYLTTLHKINMIECPDLMLQVPALKPWSSTTNTKFVQ